MMGGEGGDSGEGVKDTPVHMKMVHEDGEVVQDLNNGTGKTRSDSELD